MTNQKAKRSLMTFAEYGRRQSQLTQMERYARTPSDRKWVMKKQKMLEAEYKEFGETATLPFVEENGSGDKQ